MKTFTLGRSARTGALRATIAAAAAACAVGCTGGRGESYDVAFDRIDNVSYFGCVAVDPQRPDRLFLQIVEPPQPATAAPVTPAAQSTSVNGPWVGTRQLELVGEQREAMTGHAGHRLRVSGALEAQSGRTGNTDQLQHAQGADFRRLQVSTYEMAEGPCAVDPGRGRESEPRESH